MADLTRVGLNNQKREVYVGVGEACPTTANTIFNLPKNSVVTRAYLEVLTADSTAGAEMQVTVGSTVVADRVGVDTVGTAEGKLTVTSTDGTTTVTGDIPYTTPAYFATGGAVGIASGAVAPAGDGSVRLVVEYIELDKLSGEYTD